MRRRDLARYDHNAGQVGQCLISTCETGELFVGIAQLELSEAREQEPPRVHRSRPLTACGTHHGNTGDVVDEHPDAAGVIALYDRHAQSWSRDRGAQLVERQWLDRFVASLPDQRHTVLDVGCGTAVPIGAYLIEQGCQLHGVDGSSAMIAVSASRFPEHRWEVADMRTLALSGRFDGIIAWDSLFHLSAHDQRRMFPIFARHAAPGAVLLFNSGPSAGEQIGSYHGEPLYHASLDPCEYRSVLGDNGFHVIAHVVTDPTCGNRTIWLAQAT